MEHQRKLSSSSATALVTNTRRLSVNVPVARRKGSSAATTSRKKDDDDDSEINVRVAIRCRPMSEKEISDGHESIVEFESDSQLVIHDISKTPSDQLGTKSGKRQNISHVYKFDNVFDWNSTQADVYNSVCKPIVQSVLKGYNGTIFAYGQTGTGKTYTMEGLTKRVKSSTSKELSRRGSETGQRTNSNRGGTTGAAASVDAAETAGVIPRSFKQIFEYVSENPDVKFLIRASYMEIYQEEIRDLLRKDKSIKLELHERPDIGVYVKDLTSYICKSIVEIERVMRVGNQNRSVGATDMNEHSSRSHAIFMITIEQQLIAGTDTSSLALNKRPQQLQINGAGGSKRAQVIRVGQLNLVDLAGSERQPKTNSFGQRQKESIKINLSLSALGNVINSLVKLNEVKSDNSKNNNNNLQQSKHLLFHTPYRDSKLTRLLQDSLGGSAKTLMIANIGPASYNYDETINTLNYASRAKCIKNRPRLNEDPKDALLRELQREIDELRSKLAGGDSTSSSSLFARKGSAPTNQKQLDNNKVVVKKELLELKQKLASLEAKLLNGDKTSDLLSQSKLLRGYTEEQRLELERKQEELSKQASRELAIRDELERREEAELLTKNSFNSIQQEVDAKRKLIRQLLMRVKSKRVEIEKAKSTYRLELDDLDQLQYVLQKELKLKCLIMDNFIPNNHVDQLLPRIRYDERRNVCLIDQIELPVENCLINQPSDQAVDGGDENSCAARPKSEFERMSEAINPSNIRYKNENLIEPKLDYLSHHNDNLTTFEKRRRAGSCRRKLLDEVPLSSGGQDYEATRLQTLIDNVLSQREQDIVI